MRLLLAASLLVPSAAFAEPDRAAERAFFEKVVEIPTVEGRGEAKNLVALIRSELLGAGFEARDFEIVDYEGTQMMIARRRAANPSGEKPILLMAHMDVVEAKREDWTHDPFDFREEDGYYYGRGVRDNKAGLSALVLALKRLHEEGFAPDRDLILLFTGDEEQGGKGAALAASDYQHLIDAEYALNSDGGGGSLRKDGKVEAYAVQLAEKTYANYTLTATNPGGHSSMPRSDNAIYALSHALLGVEEYRWPQQINAASRAQFEAMAKQDEGAFGVLIQGFVDHPEDDLVADSLEAMMPGSTRTRCVATELSGGHAPNALPQKASATVNCRIFPGTSPEEVLETLQSIAGPKVGVTLEGSPSFSDPTQWRDDLAEAMRETLREVHGGQEIAILPYMAAGATDGVHLRSVGMDVFGIDGIWSYSGENIGVHGLNERIPAKAFHDNVDFWVGFLGRLAG